MAVDAPVLTLLVDPTRRFLLVGYGGVLRSCGDGGLEVITDPLKIQAVPPRYGSNDGVLVVCRYQVGRRREERACLKFCHQALHRWVGGNSNERDIKSWINIMKKREQRKMTGRVIQVPSFLEKTYDIVDVSH